ncbi:MAG: CapA family protein [Sphingopyxis sp.]|uniref:CapA family protein n=1 Tax=Sphingopyxis sp. TaxID=1908224 RepID=UPI001A61B2CD|nr:CapA family protein [Sphingopyxis sp.]MBL9071378.1 CapA family protein [Sphingopyxis sp.]
MTSACLPAPTRRHLIGAGISVVFLPVLVGAGSRPLRISLLGQSLIKTDLRALGWDGLSGFQRLLKGRDAVFTDLETVIAGPLAGKSTRPSDSEVLHVGHPEVIDCLQAIGVNIVATSNNHAWDLDSGGILSTIDALETRKLAYAGTGRDLAAASSPGFLQARERIALVSAAAGAIRDGAAATDTRPGVNELRRGPDGALVAVDVERYLAAIRLAAGSGATVIAYLHSHYWEARKSDTPAWQRDLARRAIDAGAATFVAHGVPELQGIEYYRGAPLFHGLSSFIFQSEKADGAYGPEAWQSVIAQLDVVGGRVTNTSLIPVQLDAGGIEYKGRRVRGSPRLATGSSADEVLDRLARLNAALGSSVRFGADRRRRRGATSISISPNSPQS